MYAFDCDTLVDTLDKLPSEESFTGFVAVRPVALSRGCKDKCVWLGNVSPGYMSDVLSVTEASVFKRYEMAAQAVNSAVTEGAYVIFPVYRPIEAGMSWSSLTWKKKLPKELQYRFSVEYSIPLSGYSYTPRQIVQPGDFVNVYNEDGFYLFGGYCLHAGCPAVKDMMDGEYTPLKKDWKIRRIGGMTREAWKHKIVKWKVP